MRLTSPRRLSAPTSVRAPMSIRNLLREGGAHEVIHLQKADRLTECGRRFDSIVGTWIDDDRKVTCVDCRAIRDAPRR
jgi:hypothetical protein